LGVLSILSRVPRQLEQRELRLLTAIGRQIGLYVENIQLARDVSQVEILQELNRLRGELIANVSHELRTPLGLIKVFCTTLLANDLEIEPETRIECLQHISEETDRLESIVGNLLDLSRLENARLRLDRQPTDIGQLAQSTVDKLGGAGQGQHRFIVDFPQQPLIAPVDAGRVEQVLRNLVGNAVKYSPAGSTITVRGRGDMRQATLEVRDEGAGIPAADQERIFERFYRVDNRVSQEAGGVGLGLSLARGIVEAHGGQIWVESVSGAGSCFFFTLPIQEGVDHVSETLEQLEV
jgi:two-component system sensor histidine kinase KdpD